MKNEEEKEVDTRSEIWGTDDPLTRESRGGSSPTWRNFEGRAREITPRASPKREREREAASSFNYLRPEFDAHVGTLGASLLLGETRPAAYLNHQITLVASVRVLHWCMRAPVRVTFSELANKFGVCRSADR